MKKHILAVMATSFVAVSLSACSGTPLQQSVQWVARDAWDSTCAEQAIVEMWKANNGRWKVQGEVWAVDVEATFKLMNKCESGLPLVGKSYKQFETVQFKQPIEMSKCKKGSDSGWALPGKESSRCWTGPTLLQ
jgi:hypothetical protein